MKSTYQFVPNFTVQITAPPRYIDYFDKEYWFATKKRTVRNPSLLVEIGNHLPSRKSKNLTLFKRVKVKNLYWMEYSIDLNNKYPSIYIKRHWIDQIYMYAVGPIIQSHIFAPLMYYAMVRKGYYPLHSSGISKNNRAVLFSGFGGSGKTTTSLNMCIKDGYRFLGDDIIIINVSKKKVYWFPMPLHIFTYNILKIPRPRLKQFIPFIFLLFTVIIKDVIRLILKTVISKEFLIATRIDVRTLYPHIKFAKNAKLEKIHIIGEDDKNFIVNTKRSSDLREYLVPILKKMPRHTFKVFMHKEMILLKALEKYADS